MDSITFERRLPTPVVLLLGVITAAIVVLLVMTSPAVAASEAVLLEWIFSTTLVGTLVYLASSRFTAQRSIQSLVGAGSAVAYLALRIILALWAGLS